jgi:DNA helicase-2/ATP-dependent DNA helicase PcrA
MTDYLAELNDRQREAALHTEGPLLIIAGAGAGKTKTITHRIARLIGEGVPPRQILALTFTNKAAGEMRERVRLLLERTGSGQGGTPLVLTFHSLGVRLLREFHEEANLPRSFSIWDRDDSLRAIKKAHETLGIDKPPRSSLSLISSKKGGGVSPQVFAEEAKTVREQTVVKVWELYEKALREEDALDFDDLLARALFLLREHPRVRSLLLNRWKYVTIDEYQDTNTIQYEIARILAGEGRNICVVGDTDQCIYTWRQARLENLLDFENDFPGTKVVLLEQNYRSSRTILSAANSVIEKNRRRKPKMLYTDRGTGSPIVLYEALNEVDEAHFIAKHIIDLRERDVKPKDIAILYRENFQSRVLEEAMLHNDIPYRVLGTRFFQRKEVKDILSYLRAALNGKARGDLGRAAATPPRGIGEKTLEKMMLGGEGGLPAAMKKKVAAFQAILAQVKHAAQTLPASEAVAVTIQISGMHDLYKDSDEGRERLANLGELINFAVKHDDEQPPLGIERLLEEAALQSDQDQLEDRTDTVALMTVHASKGLEFEAVFVSGLEQGLFPSEKAVLDSQARDPEEERRLFYVAITRAKEHLFLTYARTRLKYGSREYAFGSEFIDDIDARLVERIERKRSLLEDDEYTIR